MFLIRKKFNKAAWVLLVVFLLGNLNLCLLPSVASAKIKQETVSVNVSAANLSETIYTNIDSGSCEESHNIYQINKIAANRVATQKDTNNRNSILTCCQNHNGIAKINTPKDPDLGNFIFHEVATEGVFAQAELFPNSSHTSLLELPPPEGKLLASVIKKE